MQLIVDTGSTGQALASRALRSRVTLDRLLAPLTGANSLTDMNSFTPQGDPVVKEMTLNILRGKSLVDLGVVGAIISLDPATGLGTFSLDRSKFSWPGNRSIDDIPVDGSLQILEYVSTSNGSTIFMMAIAITTAIICLISAIMLFFAWTVTPLRIYSPRLLAIMSSETTAGRGSETPKARSKADETPGVADEEHLRACDRAEAVDNYAESLRILEGNPALMLAAVQLYKAGKLAELMPTPGVATPATTQEDDELTALFESDTVCPGSSVSTALPFPEPGQWPGPPFRLPTVDPPPSEPRRGPTSTYQASSVMSTGPIVGRARPTMGCHLMTDPQVVEMMHDPLSNALELGTMVQTPKPDASQAKLAQGLASREDVTNLPVPDLDDPSPAGFETTLRTIEAITGLTNNVVMAVEEHLTAQVIRTSWPVNLLKSL
ncbi:hypothetical protein HK105_209475, partial [Polyrhizophydium stewartii]